MEATELSIEERVLIDYLSHFLPADGHEKNKSLKTSQDVADDLNEMTDISLKDIAKQMVECGYKIKIDQDGKPKWMMWPV